jgi:hypothetical protein
MPSDIKSLRVLILSWGLTGFVAVLGSIPGSGLGNTGLFAGAVVGGIAGVLFSVAIARRLAWLPAEDAKGAILGGLGGFAVAAIVAVTNLHTPTIPILATSLVGVGVLVGAGAARGWRG